MTVTLAEMFRVFGRIGCLSFGGPAAQIALMHRELVEARPWLNEAQYLRALSFCMLLPGPEAMQLATYAGWRLRGIAGGLLAGLLFVLPGAAVVFALALLYARFGELPGVQAAFLGVKSVVIVIVIEALVKIAKRALSGPLAWSLAILSFFGLYVLALPFPLIIALSGLAGFLLGRATDAESVEMPRGSNSLRVIAIWGALWLAPLGLIYALDPEFLGPLAAFFSKLAVVTFGGAYAVLAYMTQAVVGEFGWLSTPQMMDALGLAETTPGPLILVTEFVGILAGYAKGGLWMAVLAGLITLWMTFTPCFLWIFAGAPYIDALAGKPRLAKALTAITCAVVGVIASLFLWFALNLFFGRLDWLAIGPVTIQIPDVASPQWIPMGLALVAALMLQIARVPLVAVLGLVAGLGYLVG